MRSTSSTRPRRGCIAAIWLAAFLVMVPSAYAIIGVGAALVCSVLLAGALILALRAERRPGGVTLPPRIDSNLPAGWASAGTQFTRDRFSGGGAGGSW